MSIWTGEDLEMVSNPVRTVREAVREYAGDGEGIDDAIIDGFILKVRADALRSAAEDVKPGSVPLYPSVIRSALLSRADRIEGREIK